MTEPTPGDRPALTFCLTLNRVTAELTRRLDHQLGALHGLSFNDFTILHETGQAPQARIRRGDLATRLGVTASAVTRLLIPLEKNGLIARQPDPRDKRVSYVVLTATGQELLAHAGPSAHQITQDLLGDLPATQLRAAASLLAELH